MKNGKSPSSQKQQSRQAAPVSSARVATTAPVPPITSSVSPNRVASRDEIASLAYTIYEARGCEPGRDLDNWLEAESTLCGTGLSAEPADSPRA